MKTPLILSLVYNKGTILASKRSPYDDLLEQGFDEKILFERVQKQHKLICAAVMAGRLEDLKRMSMKESAARRKSAVQQNAFQTGNNAPAPAISVAEATKTNKEPAASNPPANNPSTISLSAVAEMRLPPPIPQPAETPLWEPPLQIVDPELVLEADAVIEEPILAADAVEIVPDLSAAPAVKPGRLGIEFLSDTNFQGGDRKTLRLRVYRDGQAGFVSGAAIIVKVLGSTFRPLILHAQTDKQGVAAINLQLPHFRSGRAAVLIRAMSDGEEVEHRDIIRQG